MEGVNQNQGLDFFITEIPEEVFAYSDENPMEFAETRADIYPYLVGFTLSKWKMSLLTLSTLARKYWIRRQHD